MHVGARANDNTSKELFSGVPSRDLKWEDKTYKLKRVLFSSTCLFSPFDFKEFCHDLNRSFDSKSAPIRLFVRYSRFSMRLLEPGNLNENYLMECLLIVNVLLLFFFF